ncbi:MAG: cbb3-type cytochrome c oxidase subunit II, partial [Pseudomonadota bacterium]
LVDPQSVVPESIMPKYEFLLNARLDVDQTEATLATHAFVGVPYTEEMIDNAVADLRVQADPDGDWDAMLERYPGAVVSNFDGQAALTEMDALIAYLQMLGTLVDFSTFVPDASR